jgi:hypothetical protein
MENKERSHQRTLRSSTLSFSLRPIVQLGEVVDLKDRDLRQTRNHRGIIAYERTSHSSSLKTLK